MGRITSELAKLSIIFDRLRWEEKELFERAKEEGLEVNLVDAKSMPLDLTSSSVPSSIADLVLQRTISHYRGLYYAAILERWGYRVINSYKSSHLCGNKLLTTLLLSQNGIPTPHTFIAFSRDSALQIMDKMGYPVVIKPITGSWGRMIAKVRDRDEAEALLETREMLPDPQQQIYYVQEYINRPPRDIRSVVVGDRVVATIYRYQPDDDWKTNIARGGKAELLKPDSELEELMLKAAKVVGGEILGIDAMESSNGYVLHEINNNVEFKGASSVSEKNIASEIIKYVKGSVSK